MGFVEYIPSFATASCREILKGVNYASGGAGIRDETGQNLVSIMTLLTNTITLICVYIDI